MKELPREDRLREWTLDESAGSRAGSLVPVPQGQALKHQPRGRHSGPSELFEPYANVPYTHTTSLHLHTYWCVRMCMWSTSNIVIP